MTLLFLLQTFKLINHRDNHREPLFELLNEEMDLLLFMNPRQASWVLSPTTLGFNS